MSKYSYYHLAYFREKLVSGLIRSYNWTDTRDMVADGFTKGSVDRTVLSVVMDGAYKLRYVAHEYREPASNATVAPSSHNSRAMVEDPPGPRPSPC